MLNWRLKVCRHSKFSTLILSVSCYIIIVHAKWGNIYYFYSCMPLILHWPQWRIMICRIYIIWALNARTHLQLHIWLTPTYNTVWLSIWIHACNTMYSAVLSTVAYVYEFNVCMPCTLNSRSHYVYGHSDPAKYLMVVENNVNCRPKQVLSKRTYFN